MWYFMLFGIVSIWVLIDGINRKLGAEAAAWAIGVFLFGPVVVPIYVAKRPLQIGEVREGGTAWNILKNFAIFWTLTMLVAAVAGITSVGRQASTLTTDAERAGAGIGTVLGLGILFVIWLVPTLGAALLGFFLKKGSIVERGPTGPLATDGTQTTLSHGFAAAPSTTQGSSPTTEPLAVPRTPIPVKIFILGIVLGCLIGLVLLAVILPVANNRHGTNTGSNVFSNNSSSNSPPPLELPSSQESFVSIVSAAQSQSRNVANDMQRGGVKASRDQSLCAQLESLNVTDWVGTVKTIDSNSDGEGVLAVDIAPGISLQTWNNALSDIGSHTLIEPGSPVFQSASAMKPGQRVRFSGTFLSGNSDRGDCLRETSISLRGKVESPEFIFRFSNLSPYLAGQQEATPIHTMQQGFSGDFTMSKAFTTLFGNYDPSSQSSLAPAIVGNEAANQTGKVTLLLDSPFSEGGVQKHLLVTSTTVESEQDHAAGARIGAYVFANRGRDWIAEIADKEITQFGAFGHAFGMVDQKHPNGTDGQPQAVRFGPDVYGFSLTITDYHQGTGDTAELFVAPVERHFQPVLSLHLAEDNAGECGPSSLFQSPCYGFKSTVRFLNSVHAGLFDIEVDQSGTDLEVSQAGQSSISQITPANQKKLYIFSGGQYSE